MSQIPKRVTERLIREARKFQKILQTAKDRDINESDTVIIIADMLSSYLVMINIQKSQANLLLEEHIVI